MAGRGSYCTGRCWSGRWKSRARWRLRKLGCCSSPRRAPPLQTTGRSGFFYRCRRALASHWDCCLLCSGGLHLYDGRLARISLVFWVAAPLSDESWESSLSEPAALKPSAERLKGISCSSSREGWSYLGCLAVRGLNDGRLCRLDHSLNLKLTSRQLDDSHRGSTQWHLLAHIWTDLKSRRAASNVSDHFDSVFFDKQQSKIEFCLTRGFLGLLPAPLSFFYLEELFVNWKSSSSQHYLLRYLLHVSKRWPAAASAWKWETCTFHRLCVHTFLGCAKVHGTY